MTRFELYSLVWSKPMSQLAKEFNLSDVGLRKICHKHDIPTPPIGYWAMLAHGKPVDQPALPPLSKGVSDQVYLVVTSQVEAPEQVLVASEAATMRESQPSNAITVPSKRPQTLHDAVAMVDRALRQAKPDAEGFLKVSQENAPQVTIGSASVERALIFLDTFFKALPARNYDVELSPKTCLVIADGARFAVRLHEGKDKFPHVPTAQELKWQQKREEDRQRYPNLYSSTAKTYRTWDYRPSGRLIFEVTDPAEWSYHKEHLVGRWHDRGSKKLEDYLNDMMVSLATGAAFIKHRRDEREEQERLRAAVEARRQLEAARLQRAKKLHEFMARKALDVEEIQRLEALHEFLSRETGLYEDGLVDRFADAIEETIAAKRAGFQRESLEQEIERLGLYTLEELEREEPLADLS